MTAGVAEKTKRSGVDSWEDSRTNECSTSPAADPASPKSQTRDGTSASYAASDADKSKKGRYASGFRLKFGSTDELIRRIEELEYYRRGWKATALVFGALWLSSLIMCLGLFAGKHVQAIRAEEQARQRAVIERDMAEAARLEAAREAQAKKE